MRADLHWLGLDWDWELRQSECGAAHEGSLDRLAGAGLLYPCVCSRRDVRAHGLAALDGGYRYPGTCRSRSLPPGGWRETQDILRVRIERNPGAIADESGARLEASGELGDPIVRRRDGSIAYLLATVVDDAAAGVTRIVRGRDLANSTPQQVALQQLLDLPTPTYRHHLLLLEQRGAKLAKFHAAVGAEALRARYSAATLCGLLAWLAGLQPEAAPATPAELVPGFDWGRVQTLDRGLRWTGTELVALPIATSSEG